MGLLEMKNIVKTFPGVVALSNGRLELEAGEIHALVGENGAGKSTLMKILIGLYRPNSGEIYLGGEKVDFHSPSDALNHGISMIHQETTLVNSMSVAENIWIGREDRFLKFGLIIDKAKRNKAAEKFLRQLNLDVKPTDIVNNLSTANKQMVELARAMSYDSRIIIMDEPTSSLSDKEISSLYQAARELSAKGVALIFISHKLDEILEICSRITVMRDGEFIKTFRREEVNEKLLISCIAGREINDLYPPKSHKVGKEAIRVEHLTSKRAFTDISFTAYEGEILGFCGLVGAGRTEVMRAIFGRDARECGEIYIKGKLADIKNPKQAIQYGMAMVTEDRLQTGIMAGLSIKSNIGVVHLSHFRNKIGLVNGKKEVKEITEAAEGLNVKYSSLNQVISALSGGNQQKSIIARWLLTAPDILILDEPTRGIDVGAKSEIHKLIRSLADAGKTILLVSSELPELIGMSDRIIVMRNGKIAGEFDSYEADQKALMECAFGY